MTITNPNYEETWSLDETGNWREYQQDTDGDGTWDLIQSRTSNKVNEITNITETVGNVWTTPVYNKSGNMTTIPTPDDPTTSYTATYDAWNRLVKLTDGSNTITEYQYDGTRRRVLHKVYNIGVLDHTKHLYYNNNWQLLEERRDTNTTPTKQFIWGNRYIDDLVLRDHDTNDDGTLNERLYALQDANWNVTSYINSSGTVQERYIYNAYGHVTFLDNNFGVRTSSTIEPDHLYAGYNYDSDVEMYHVRNRVYHPMLGTWLQRDPIGYDGGINLYEHVRSTPTLYLDPFGLWVPFVIVGWSAIVSKYAGITIFAGFVIGGASLAYYATDGNLESTLKGGILGAVAGNPVLFGMTATITTAITTTVFMKSANYYKKWHRRNCPEDYDPASDGFKLCRRNVREVDCLDKVVNRLGGQHTYIQYGGVNDSGHPKNGTVGYGIGPCSKGTIPSEESAFRPNICVALKRSSRKLGLVHTDISADKATDQQILDCIKSCRTTQDYDHFNYNCNTWAYECLKKCGLDLTRSI